MDQCWWMWTASLVGRHSREMKLIDAASRFEPPVFIFVPVNDMTLQFLGAKILGKHILQNKRKWAIVVCPLHFLLNAFATQKCDVQG